MNSEIPLPSSFRDPSGFLFWKEGILYRQVNHSYSKDYDHLMQSGFYDELIKQGLIVPHEDVSGQFDLVLPAYKVIRPHLLSFISYPYEWCFSQLKDAALVTLRIQKTALEFGMSLKDSSAYNIQFHQGKPVLMDTLSFEIYREGEPWVAYRQFCQHFLAPLSLMAFKDIRLSSLLRIYIDGIPLDLVAKLLPLRTKFNFPLLTHIHLHATAQKRFSDQHIKIEEMRLGKVSQSGLLGLIESLDKSIEKLDWNPTGTEWGEYYNSCHYTEQSFETKKEIIESWIEKINPITVWDLGANVGFFSRLFADKGIQTNAFDVDPAAVELNYRQVIANKEKFVLPLLMDLTNPSPDQGWSNQERQSLMERGPADLVLVLALIHHLVISNNVPLHDFCTFIGRICKWSIVEFVPKDDPLVQKLLMNRIDIFDQYDRQHFELNIEKIFQICEVKEILGTQRLLYLLKKRGPDSG